MTIINKGAETDRLTGISGRVARKIELHRSLKKNGVMRMRAVEEGIVVPPGETLRLQPNGLHVMLMNLERPLEAGQTFPLILHFEKAGAIAVEVSVRKATS